MNRHFERRSRRGEPSGEEEIDMGATLNPNIIYKLRREYEEWLPPALRVDLEEAAYFAENEEYDDAITQIERLLEKERVVIQRISKFCRLLEKGMGMD